jgi:hypothetical protein
VLRLLIALANQQPILELRTLEGHSDAVIGVAVSPRGRRAVAVIATFAGDAGGHLHFLELELA